MGVPLLDAGSATGVIGDVEVVCRIRRQATGIGDVAGGRAFQSGTGALVLAAGSLLALLGVWYGYPLWRRARS